jgi:hypothetical protein
MLDLSIFNHTSFSGLEEFIFFIVNFAVSFSVVLAVIALIVAGFRFILAIGDQDKVGVATKSLIFALIGLILVFIAPTIIEFIIHKVIIIPA